MKRVFVYIVLASFILVIYACEPDTPENCKWGTRPYCTYEHPLNIKNLKDTIKITDTLWIENDFDAYFCLSQPIKNGSGVQAPFGRKLRNDSLIRYVPFVTNYTEKKYSGINREHTGYEIAFIQQDGRYKSKYGIVFPDTGIYGISFDPWEQINFGKHKACYIELSPYFDVSDNNCYLLPEEFHKYQYCRKPYRDYFFVVVK